MKIYKTSEQIKYGSNHGSFSFIYREGELLDLVKKDYQREGIVLKIFFRPYDEKIPLSEYIYGHYFVGGDYEDRNSKLLESLKVQNLCAFEGLAPRVYGVDLLVYEGHTFPMIVVEDMGINPGWDVRQVSKVWDKLAEVSKKYGFTLGYFDGNPQNLVADKWVDFQGFALVNNYVDKLKERIISSATWSENHYQSVPQLGIDGFRKTDIRTRELGLDKVNFNGKRVLDVGCSGGQFSMYAVDKGASYVVAADLPEVIAGTRELANYLGYFSIDWHGIDVTTTPLDYEADITFYLSMYMHVGLLEWVVKSTREMMIFETNGISEQDAKDILKKYFSRVETMGYASDFDGRSIIHCYK